MNATELRRKIEKAIDRLLGEWLKSLATFVAFVNCASLGQRLAHAEKEVKSGKGVNWRKIHS